MRKSSSSATPALPKTPPASSTLYNLQQTAPFSQLGGFQGPYAQSLQGLSIQQMGLQGASTQQMHMFLWLQEIDLARVHLQSSDAPRDLAPVLVPQAGAATRDGFAPFSHPFIHSPFSLHSCCVLPY